MKPLSYTKFLWKSSNAHGIHSPFVYNLVTKCFYSGTPKLYRSKKHLPVENISIEAANTLHKVVSGVKASKLYVLGNKADEATKILQASGEKANTQPWFFSTLAPIPGTIDLAYISGSDTESLLPLLEQILPNTNSNTVCVIDNIHTTEATEKAWEAIKENPNVTVTIDTYYLGLVFFRKEQAKQHFMVRPFTNRFTNAILGVRNLWGLI